MDAIRLKQAQSRVESLVKLADASGQRLKAMQKRFEHFDTAAKRVEKLVEDNSAPRQQLDDLIIERDTTDLARGETEFSTASLDADIATAKLEPALIEQTIADKRYLIKTLALKIEQADARLKQYNARLEQAAARLALAEHTLSLARIASPVRGVVLQRLADGASPVSAGMPLLVVGNLDDLDIIAEVLTTDALKLKPGTIVELSPASGMEPFAGRVVRIEPAGFTKLSSLGVEQQRVNVIIAPQSRPSNLGIGYRVQSTFITAEKPDALTVPRYSALQDRDFKFYVLKSEVGKPPVKTAVEIGLRGRLDLEILNGVDEKDSIVRTPTAAQMGE
jgi:HlyD family secretion protein